MAKFEQGNTHGNRFQKGVSGNPLGKGKSALLTDAVRRRLADGTDLDRIVTALIAKARKGDLEAVKIIFDRLEGKPKQFIDADLKISQDWKTHAETYNLSINEIIDEARRLLEAGSGENDDESNEQFIS